MSVSSVYNVNKQILKRYKKAPPSLSLHIFATHFRFEQLNGVFLYESPMTALIDDYIKVHRLPIELLEILDAGKVPFYDGCLIVAMNDYRSPPSASTPGPSGKPNSAFGPSTSTVTAPSGKAETYRIVLLPNDELLHADLALQGLDAEEALRVESRLLQLTTAPLCLDPSFECTRIANTMYRSTMILPTKDDLSPGGKKSEALSPASALRRSRNGAAMTDEDCREEKERTKRRKLMHVMDENWQRPFAPTFDRMGFVEQHRADRKAAISHPAPPSASIQSASAQAQTQAMMNRQAAAQVKKPMQAPLRNMPAPPSAAQLPNKKKAAVPGPTGPAPKPKAAKPSKKSRDDDWTGSYGQSGRFGY